MVKSFYSTEKRFGVIALLALIKMSAVALCLLALPIVYNGPDTEARAEILQTVTGTYSSMNGGYVFFDQGSVYADPDRKHQATGTETSGGAPMEDGDTIVLLYNVSTGALRGWGHPPFPASGN